MQKDFTSLKKTNLKQVTLRDAEPKKETLQKILQFAAVYRVEILPGNIKAEVFLN